MKKSVVVAIVSSVILVLVIGCVLVLPSSIKNIDNKDKKVNNTFKIEDKTNNRKNEKQDIKKNNSNNKKAESGKKSYKVQKGKSLMFYGEYRKISVNNIEKIVITKYTEAGDATQTITGKAEMLSIYSMLQKLRIGKETKKSCEDNTIVYTFYLKNKSKVSIEIECDWVVIKDKRYIIK